MLISDINEGKLATQIKDDYYINWKTLKSEEF